MTRKPDTAALVELGPHNNMTVEQCLEYCRREQGKYEDVLVLAYDEDEKLVIRSSHMLRKDVLWMLMEAVDDARGG